MALLITGPSQRVGRSSWAHGVKIEQLRCDPHCKWHPLPDLSRWRIRHLAGSAGDDDPRSWVFTDFCRYRGSAVMWLRDVRRIRLVGCVAMAATVTVVAFLAVAVPDTATASVTGHSWRPKPTASPRPTASVTQSPTASPSLTASTSPSPTASTSPTPDPSSCASGAAPVEHGGTSYCPGYVFAVRRTLYGVDTRIVLRGVVVESASGSQVRVAGDPRACRRSGAGRRSRA